LVVAGASGYQIWTDPDTEAEAPVRQRSNDPFDLQRFVVAQDSGAIFDRALAELHNGRKESHWMWFVFPQVAGLGTSPMARTYAITSLDEALAYLAHPVLGPRLHNCATALVDLRSAVDADDILGPVDARKLRSSMTLFLRAAPGDALFESVLQRYFDGRRDPATEARLGQAAPGVED
jgi:uncharacterized protein (DUF1810 family)